MTRRLGYGGVKKMVLVDTPLVVPVPVPGKTMLITGRKGDGKSYYGFNEIFLEFRGVGIYVDPKGVNPRDSYFDDAVEAGVVENRYSLKEIQERPARKILLRCVPGASPRAFDREVRATLEWLVDWKRGFPGEALLIVLDEAQRYMTKSGFVDEVDILIQTCSALNISTLIINPDYSTVPRQLYFQCDYVIFFTPHPVILIYLEERLQVSISERAKLHMESEYHGICYDWKHIYLVYPDGRLVLDTGDEGDGKEEISDEDRGIDCEPGEIRDAREDGNVEPGEDATTGGGGDAGGSGVNDE